jgi:nitroreductase
MSERKGSSMETWEAIISRRNVREYTDQPIIAEDLDRVLEAAWRTPSSRNLQRWDFVVSTDRTQLETLSRCWRGAGHVARSAATISIVAPIGEDDRTRQSIQYDLGQATMSIMLAASDLGIGTGHAAVEDQDLAREVLGFPGDSVCAWMIALGYPADRPLAPIRNPLRRPFDEVVHRGTWGS